MKVLLESRWQMVTVLAAAAIMLGLGSTMRLAFLNAFDSLDREFLKNDVARFVRVVKERKINISSKVGDWCTWDEPFEFIMGLDPKFAETNITPNAIDVLRIDALAFLDKNLNVMLIKKLNSDRSKLLDVSLKDTPFLKSDSEIIKDSINNAMTAFVLFEGKPALAAAKAVTRSDGLGPAVGRIVFIQIINQNFLDSLKEQTLLTVSFEPRDVEKSLNLESDDLVMENEFTLIVWPNHAEAILVGPNSDKNRIGHFRLILNREIKEFGVRSVRKILYLFTFLSVIALFALGFSLRFFKVHTKLSQMTQFNSVLEERDAQMRALIDSVPGYVSWFNRSLEYLGVNGKLASDFDLKPEDIIGKKIGFQGQLSKPDMAQELQSFFESNEHFRQTPVFITSKDGKQRKFLVCFEKYNQNHAAILVGIDITDNWHLEEQSAKDRQFASNASRLSALGEMAGGIAHEINNPLAIIHAACHKLSRMMDQKADVAAQKEMVTKIETTSQRISVIIKGLRSFARDGSNDPFSSSNLNQILEDTFALCQERFKSHGVTLHKPVLPRDYPVRCRPVQIGQVFLNLLNNSYDAICDLDEKWIRVEVNETNDAVEVAVVDSGSGLSNEIADKIMQPFFTTKAIGKGTGLGLSISLGIMRDHGGSLVLDRSSKNTRFVVRLMKDLSRDIPATFIAA